MCDGWFCQLVTNLELPGETGILVEKKIPKPMGCFLDLMVDVGVPSGASPGQVVLSCKRKHSEKDTGNKAVSSDPSWPLLQSLAPGSCLTFLP